MRAIKKTKQCTSYTSVYLVVLYIFVALLPPVKGQVFFHGLVELISYSIKCRMVEDSVGCFWNKIGAVLE